MGKLRSQIQRQAFHSIIITISLALVTGCSGGGGSGGSNKSNTNNLTIGGTILGNNGSVTLSLNGTEETFSSSSFIFSSTIANGGNYAVQFVSTATNQQCSLQNNVGTAVANISNITVTCTNPVSVLSYADAQVTGHMTTGDFNGDGFADLVFSIFTAPGHVSGTDKVMYRVAYGNGTGGFSGYTDVASLGEIGSGRLGHGLIAGDFNTDNLTDFAASGGNILEIYAGSISEVHTTIYRNFNVDAPYGSPIYAFDANDDNTLDLIIDDATHLYFYENSAGAFTSRTAIGNRPTISPMNFTLADFNGDGVEDILVLGLQDSDALELGLFSGNGDGSFATPSSLQSLSDDLYLGQVLLAFPQDHKDLSFGDFDADGDLDIVITSTTDFLQVLLNDSNGNFTATQRVKTGNAPVHVQVADFNLDQIPDLVSINLDSNTLSLHYGVGDGTFGDSTASAASWLEIDLENDVDPYDLAVADLNGDAYPDIVFAEIGTRGIGAGSIQIFLSPGAP